MAVQERSIATRAALLDAAIECLVDRGYVGTTTTEISRRARVSRGAQLHHFPTKAELLATAVEHLVERRRIEFVEAFQAVDPAVDPLDAALDLLWSLFEGPAFVAWTELWVTARTDPDLAATILTVERRFTEQTREMFKTLLPAGGAADSPLADIGRDLAFAVMQGVAFQRLLPHPVRPATEYVDALKALFHLVR